MSLLCNNQWNSTSTEWVWLSINNYQLIIVQITSMKTQSESNLKEKEKLKESLTQAKEELKASVSEGGGASVEGRGLKRGGGA